MFPPSEDSTFTGGDFVAELAQAWGLDIDAVRRRASEPLPPRDMAAEIRRQRMDTFHRLCPPEFHQAIDESLIPNIAAWREADAWDGSFPGLWLWSESTGEAKSRMLWRKFGMFHVEHGKSVQRVTGLNLAEEYADCRAKASTANFYRHVCGTDVLMLDDLDKMNLPDDGQGFSGRDDAVRNARFLRELFDTFYEERSRVLVTSNRSIEWFGKRIGASCERRMRAVCREIEF